MRRCSRHPKPKELIEGRKDQFRNYQLSSGWEGSKVAGLLSDGLWPAACLCCGMWCMVCGMWPVAWPFLLLCFCHWISTLPLGPGRSSLQSLCSVIFKRQVPSSHPGLLSFAKRLGPGPGVPGCQVALGARVLECISGSKEEDVQRQYLYRKC